MFNSKYIPSFPWKLSSLTLSCIFPKKHNLEKQNSFGRGSIVSRHVAVLKSVTLSYPESQEVDMRFSLACGECPWDIHISGGNRVE